MSLFQNLKISSLSLWQICSLMRGGIAERGGIRVGHRIIEINGQSVVATSHDKIIHILTGAVGEVSMEAQLDFPLLQMQWNIIRTYSHICDFYLSWLADSLEDNASINISTLNRTRAASISLNTAFSIKDKNMAVSQKWTAARFRKYYAIDHIAHI